MIVRDFRVEKDEDYGGLGLKPLWMQNANAFDARAAAHDVLEHNLDEPGPAQGECMAMGACVYVRGLNGWFQRRYPHNFNTTESHIGSTLAQVMREVRFGDQTLGEPGRTMPVRDDMVEAMFDEILREGCSHWDGEMKYTVEPDGTKPITNDELRKLLGWLRKGYRRARSRLGPIGHSAAGYLFDMVEAKLKPHVCEENEGIKVTVKVDVPRSAVIVIPHYDDD